MLPFILMKREIGEFDVGPRRPGEDLLDPLGLELDSPVDGRIVADAETMGPFEAVEAVIGERPVEVVAPEMYVAIDRETFVNALAQVQDRNIERSAAQVVDRDLLEVLEIIAVRQRGRR